VTDNQTYFFSTFAELTYDQAAQTSAIFQLPQACLPNATSPGGGSGEHQAQVAVTWLIVGCALSAVSGLVLGGMCGLRRRWQQWRAHAANVQFAYTKALMDAI
jgi:hypothetical protein